MSYFMRNGDVFTPTPSKDSILGGLPVGNYIVIETMQGLMFKKVDSFTEPGRMYGSIHARADRILNTFAVRERSTGVLLHGEKGSGKSQLARVISHNAYRDNIPTILVNAPFMGDAFNALLATIEQPAIVLMDEFEKVYSEREMQEQVLTLLDGVMTSKKLFILTVNDRYRVNDHMHNRPGRIFYSIGFDGLEPDFVREYCEDNLDDKDQIESVMKIGAMFKAFNFDMLKALVEEMNRYKESAFDAMELLNAKPFIDTASATYDVIVTSPTGLVSKPTETKDLPMTRDVGIMGIYVEFEKPKDLEKKALKALATSVNIDPDGFDRQFAIKSDQLKSVDVEAGKYVFAVDGFQFVFTKKPPVYYDYRSV